MRFDSKNSKDNQQAPICEFTEFFQSCSRKARCGMRVHPAKGTISSITAPLTKKKPQECGKTKIISFVN